MTKEDQPLSRAAYRKQQEELEKQAKAAQPEEPATSTTTAAPEASRRTSKKRKFNFLHKSAPKTEFSGETEASPLLKKRLNWAIGIVAVLIVLVYLVLFFV